MRRTYGSNTSIRGVVLATREYEYLSLALERVSNLGRDLWRALSLLGLSLYRQGVLLLALSLERLERNSELQYLRSASGRTRASPDCSRYLDGVKKKNTSTMLLQPILYFS